MSLQTLMVNIFKTSVNLHFICVLFDTFYEYPLIYTISICMSEETKQLYYSKCKGFYHGLNPSSSGTVNGNKAFILQYYLPCKRQVETVVH